MTPHDFAPLLARLPSKRVVFVNTASASGPFVEALSGPGRVIVTATRSGAEKYRDAVRWAIRRGVHDRSGRRGSQRRVTRSSKRSSTRRSRSRPAYQREGLMQTEHALLDDNGDSEGSMEPGAQAKDGQSAAVLSLGSTRKAGCAGQREAARALCRTPGARAADRVAEAAEERHGSGEVRRRSSKSSRPSWR